MRLQSTVLIVAFAAVLSPAAYAHEMRPGYLEIRESAPDIYEVLWKVPARGTNERLGLYLRFADDVEMLTEPVSGFTAGAYIQRMRIRRTGGLTGSPITIDGLTGSYTDVLLRLERADGTELTRLLTPDRPTYVVEANPGLGQVIWAYFVLGGEHILLGIDHLLFILALLLVVVGWRKLVGAISAFTVAHSITLAAATLGFVHVPQQPVEAAIALSIVFVACELVHQRQGRPGLTQRRPWIVAFAFGLLHGLGFAGALSEVGLPQQAIPSALLFFNVGVEAGQLLFVSTLLLLWQISLRLRVEWPRWAWQVMVYGIGSVAAYWFLDRTLSFWA